MSLRSARHGLTKDGRSKLVRECTYPLTGLGCVGRIYTDYGVFEISADGVNIRETYGVTAADLRTRVGLDFATL
jgi:3-oxoadipate CoA-transferase beta subunit